MEKMLFTAEEAAHALGIGRTRVFALIRSGELESVKIGVSRRITRDAIDRFIRSIEHRLVA